MPVTALPPFAYPVFWGQAEGTPAVGSFGASLNASGDRVAWIVRVPKSGTLHSFEFNISTVTNNPDNGIRLSFQDVSATTGFQDNVADQFRNITGTITAGWQVPPGNLTSDGTNGGVARTVVAGDLIACVVDFVTFVASDSFDANSMLQNGSTPVADRGSYAVDTTNGIDAKVTGGYGIFALKYSDGTYADLPGYWGPITTITSTSFGSGSTPDEIGNKFTAPIAYQTYGAWFRGIVSGDVTVKLYDSNDVLLGSGSIDKDQVSAASNQSLHQVIWTQGPISLVANAVYRVTVVPTTATTITLGEFTVPATGGGMAAIPGGATMFRTTRTDAGAWTDTATTSRAVVGLLCNGLNVAASGGGNSGGAVYINYEG